MHRISRPYKLLTRLSLVALTALLAGCGGGGAPATTDPPASTLPAPTNSGNGGGNGGDTGGGTGIVQAEGGAAKRSAAAGMVQIYAPDLPIEYTPLASVPTTGSATYLGYFYGDISGTSQNLIGDLRVVVGFNSSSVSISGDVTDMYDADNETVTGELTLSQGQLKRSGNPAEDATLFAAIAGQLNADGQTINVDARFEGDFISGTYGAMGGAVLGTAAINGTDRNFDGGFIARR